MTSDQPRSRLQELLRQCAWSRRGLAPADCFEAATEAILVDPFSIRARRNVCWALFALKRYKECHAACHDATKMINRLGIIEPSPSQLESVANQNTMENHEETPVTAPSLEERMKERYLFRRMQRACVICRRTTEREADGNETVTNQLQNGWYKNCLLERIASGEIRPFVMIPPRFRTICGWIQ